MSMKIRFMYYVLHEVVTLPVVFKEFEVIHSFFATFFSL